jgi:hypothetical protein
MHGAGTALTHTTPKFCSRLVQLITQGPEQGGIIWHIDADVTAIEFELDHVWLRVPSQ